MFNKIETYTFGEFKEVMNKKELYVLDAEIGILKKNNIINYKKVVFMLALFMLTSPINAFAVSNAFDPAGLALFDLVVSIAKWVFIAKGGWEIIQKVGTGCDIGDISGVVTKYGMAYGAIIILPKILTMLGNAIEKINL